MNNLIKIVLEFAHMPEAEIADISNKMPAVARLSAAAKELEPILTKAMPLIEQLQPLLMEAWPITQKEWPDVVAVTPTAEELAEFASQKGN
jgi:hypothetical protein